MQTNHGAPVFVDVPQKAGQPPSTTLMTNNRAQTGGLLIRPIASGSVTVNAGAAVAAAGAASVPAKANVREAGEAILFEDPNGISTAFVFFAGGDTTGAASAINFGAGYDDDDTSIVVVDGGAFTIGEVYQPAGGTEFLQVTNIVSNTLTVTRGYAGTTASTLADNQRLFLVPTAVHSASALTFVNLTADTTAAEVMARLETAINGAAIGITSDDAAADGTTVLTVDTAGAAGNNWTLTEFGNDAGFTVTDPTNGEDAGTFLTAVGGVPIMAAVTWTTNADTTAGLIATAINLYCTENELNYRASASSAVVTIQQTRSGAEGSVVTATTGAGDATDAVFSGATDAFTEPVNGGTNNITAGHWEVFARFTRTSTFPNPAPGFFTTKLFLFPSAALVFNNGRVGTTGWPIEANKINELDYTGGSELVSVGNIYASGNTTLSWMYGGL